MRLFDNDVDDEDYDHDYCVKRFGNLLRDGLICVRLDGTDRWLR